jgi:serine phosphatase RsbU (regulator of sigma subunit)
VNAKRLVIGQSVAAALCAYVVAGSVETAVIDFARPSEWELAWVSDFVLALILGVAVYLWRGLLITRRELSERDRAELVLQSQLSMAAEIQRRLLPPTPTPADGFEWAAALTSAGKIGGDLYDFVEPVRGLWLILVADVSGKGIPAAMALGTLRSAFRAVVRESSEPAQIVAQLSTTLHGEWSGSPYVTCIVAALDVKERTLTYTNAGHPAGIVVGRRAAQHLTRGGPPVGLLPGVQFEQERIALQAGDVCLLVSDGVTEALEGDEPVERDVVASIQRHTAPSAADLCDAVMARARAGHGPVGILQWEDDRTVVVVTLGEQPFPADAPGLADGAGSRRRGRDHTSVGTPVPHFTTASVRAASGT